MEKNAEGASPSVSLNSTGSRQINSCQREEKIHQKGAILWLTGLSGAGKTTLSLELEKKLCDRNKLVYILDGDIIRKGLNSDLGFSPEDRCENIRRIGEVAKLFADAAILVVVAFISPFRADRERVRQSSPAGRFIEIYLNCPLKVCQKRDPKGLYKKALKGEIKEFTGISSPYEPPLSPEIELSTDKETVEECTQTILKFLGKNSILNEDGGF